MTGTAAFCDRDGSTSFQDSVVQPYMVAHVLPETHNQSSVGQTRLWYVHVCDYVAQDLAPGTWQLAPGTGTWHLAPGTWRRDVAHLAHRDVAAGRAHVEASTSGVTWRYAAPSTLRR
jgi:hypothetical protein